jgi:hypothetical protein
MKNRTLRTASVAGLAAMILMIAGAATSAKSKNRDMKLRLRAQKTATAPGGTATLEFRVTNRTAGSLDISAVFTYRDLGGDPFATRSLTLAAKEKQTISVSCPVPADWIGKRLRVTATVGELSVDTKVKTVPAEFSDALWLQGRDLFQSNCAARCHGTSGGEVRRDGLKRWRFAIQNGPGSMPRSPEITYLETILMREFARDAKRAVTE